LEHSTSKPETWQLKEFGQAYDPNGGGSNFVSIPKFQRSLVWSEDQRRMLVDSLYRGFPIGAILGYQTGLKNGKRNVVQIVDGLQRSTTIAEYLKQPLYYAPADLVFSEDFISLVSKTAGFGLDKDSLAKVLLALENWLREVKVARLGAAFNAEKLTKSIASTLDIAEELFEPITDLVSEELGSVLERVKEVESLPIPLIMYSGDVGNIATIFERVNNQGTQLSKYEILASSWVSYQTRITNEDIRKKILAKYDVLRSRGFEIDGLPEGSAIGEDEYNLYEYLFGLGKLLAQKFPRLFGQGGAADESLAFGFVIVTTAVGLRLSKMGDLVTKIRGLASDPNAPINLNALEAAIMTAASAIDLALKPYLSLKLNKREDESVLVHSQNQIISLVTAYLVTAFDRSTWTANNSERGKDILKNAPSHYLLDIAAKRWRGSGDSRLFEVTWNEDASLPSGYYAERVTRASMTDALRQAHEEMLTKAQKSRPNVPGIALVAQVFLYSSLVVVRDNVAVDFELEHIYPVSLISTRIDEIGDEGWPISAMGNLMLLPKDLNRIKGKNALGDYIPTLSGDEVLTAKQLRDVNTYLLAPEYEAITKASLLDKEYFIQFCRERMTKIADKIADNLELL